MRRFRFKLERLENVRSIELNGLRIETLQAEQAHRLALDELAAFRQALEQSYEQLGEFRRAGADSLILQSLESYNTLLLDRLNQASRAVVQREEQLRLLRERLTDKHSEKKALEKVRERRQAEHRLGEARAQQDELDETAALRRGGADPVERD